MLISLLGLTFLYCCQGLLYKFLGGLYISRNIQGFLLKNSHTSTGIRKFYYVKVFMGYKLFVAKNGYSLVEANMLLLTANSVIVNFSNQLSC